MRGLEILPGDNRPRRGRSRDPGEVEYGSQEHSLGAAAGYFLIGIGTLLLYWYGGKGSGGRDDTP